MTRATIKTFVGRQNSGPPRPFVELELDGFGWLSPRQAMKLAQRLMKAAVEAEDKFKRREDR